MMYLERETLHYITKEMYFFYHPFVIQSFPSLDLQG